jgi:hypothetical protein
MLQAVICFLLPLLARTVLHPRRQYSSNTEFFKLFEVLYSTNVLDTNFMTLHQVKYKIH